MFTFREIETADAQLILDWRTSRRVAKYLKTEFDHGLEDQEQWIISCRESDNFYHWLIVYQEQPIGYISISDYNPMAKTTSWGFYIGEEEHTGLGGLVVPFFYRFCFSELGIERIDAEMLYFNTKVIDLHQLHGYEFAPERDRIVKKQGKRVLLIAMSLEKYRFEHSKFARHSAKFPMEKWNAKKPKHGSEVILNQVTGTEEQIKSLYRLLEKRTFSISHDEMPDFHTHQKFVKNHPYRDWLLVKRDEEVIGSVYLTDENSLGINLLTTDSGIFCQIIQQLKRNYEPLPAKPSVRPGFFYVNAAPENSCLKLALADMGAKHTQNSYRI